MILFRRVGVMVALAFLLASSMVFSVGSPASAASSDYWSNVHDLFNYKLLKSGTELQAQMGPNAAARWGAQAERVATQSASAYNVAAVTSGVTNHVPDPVYIRPQDLPEIRPSSLPRSVTKFTGIGLNKPSGVIGATVAMTGFEYRAQITDGVTSWLGINANDAVCSDPTASGGFINWLSGQDCSAYAFSAAQQAAANADAVSGFVGDRVCSPGDLPLSQCVTFLGYGDLWGSPPYAYKTFCFKVEGDSMQVANDDVTARYELQAPDGATDFSSGFVWHIAGESRSWSQCSSHYPQTTAVEIVDALGTYGNTHDWTLSSYGFSDPSGGGYLGSSGAVHFSSSNPNRWWVCDLTGDDGQTYSAQSDSFTEGDTAAVPPACPNLPPGVTATHMKITEIGGAEPLVVSDQDALADPLGDGSDTNGVTEAHCQTHMCVLELMDLRSGKSCFDEGDACDGWIRSPSRDTDYKCFYGGVEQDFKQCYAYAHIFNTQKRLAGDVYADPSTGEDLGIQSGVTADQATMGQPSTAPAPTRSCWGGTDWGTFNPLNWVLRPVQCALEWAFVPDAAVVKDQFDHMADQWADTPFGQVPAVVNTFTAIPVFTGCTGLPVDVNLDWPFDWGIHWNLGASCSGPMATLAGVVRTVSGGLLLVGGVVTFTRYVSSGIGFVGFGRAR